MYYWDYKGRYYFDDVIKMLMSAKIFLDILKAYMMVYIIIKFLRL